MLSIEVVFFFLAVVSLPNLFFRGEYNTAVFFFSCGCWTSQYKTTVVYILLLSWLIDAYSLISYIADSKHGLNIPGREMVFWITFFLFVVKIITIVWAVVKDTEAKEALSLSQIADNVRNLYQEESIQI